MRMLPREAIEHFENVIYLPMIMTILTIDQTRIQNAPFKFPRTYLSFIDEVLVSVQKDLKQSTDYLRNNNMKLLKGKSEGIFTEYIFMHNGYEDSRNYLNVRLRNRTEELMDAYFSGK